MAQDIECALTSDANVLISGGDRHHRLALACTIHEGSTRRAYPFVHVRPADPLSAALGRFEHVRLAVARGTLFIEEAATLSPPAQADLLRVLEGSSLRVIAGTAVDLFEQIASHGFDEKLFYRLNTLHLVLAQEPPDRTRLSI
jgi:DNA-binding NtrC family response regulator